MHLSTKRALILVCIFLLLAVPILIRLPSATFPDMTEEERQPFYDEEGRYYLTDPDSYYYVRNVKQHLETGRFGDSTWEDGTPRDSLRYYPEGTKANNSPGIVYLTEAVWKPLNALFGTDLYAVEYCLAAAMAALAGVAAFLMIRRISGNVGGLAGGILVSCAPIFVQRTIYGRFDTDLFVVLMDILLMLFLSEALRAKTLRGRIGYSGGFVLTAWIYSKCWTAEVVLVITGFTLFGGMVFLAWNGIEQMREKKHGTIIQSPEGGSSLPVMAGCAVITLMGMMALHGTGIFENILSFIPLTANTVTGTDIMPNTMKLVLELDVPSWFPESFGQWFWDPNTLSVSVMTGVGGVMVMLTALGGLVWLAKQSIWRFYRDDGSGLKTKENRIYLCILLVTLGSWCFLIRYGIRFVEHLSVPVGILAGTAIGRVATGIREKSGKIQWLRAGMCALLTAATIVPAGADAVGLITGIHPSVTRVSDEAMDWVRENAEDPEAVIASWWDLGYYYEAASGHPCLWDGGSSQAVRAILISKALTARDTELSRRILLMLSTSGDQAVNELLEHVDAKTAFEMIWETLLLEKEATEEQLKSRCGLTAAEAEEIEACLHPAKAKETYLIVTDTMMMQIGWFEYYAYWDFRGNNPIPLATTLRYTPDGYPIDSQEGQDYMDEIRARETLWRLYIEEEEADGFELVFNRRDDAEGMWMWRVV